MQKVQFKNIDQLKIYLLSMVHGLAFALDTYEAEVENRDKAYKEFLNKVAKKRLFDQIQRIIEVPEGVDIGLLITKYYESIFDIEISEAISMFDSISRLIGDSYEALDNLTEKGIRKLDRIIEFFHSPEFETIIDQESDDRLVELSRFFEKTRVQEQFEGVFATDVLDKYLEMQSEYRDVFVFRDHESELYQRIVEGEEENYAEYEREGRERTEASDIRSYFKSGKELK